MSLIIDLPTTEVTSYNTTKRQTDKSSTQPRMLPPTLRWLVLVYCMVSVCQASGRYDVDTDAYMDPRPAGSYTVGQDFNKTAKISLSANMVLMIYLLRKYSK